MNFDRPSLATSDLVWRMLVFSIISVLCFVCDFDAYMLIVDSTSFIEL
jgi:hypothetical protein